MERGTEVAQMEGEAEQQMGGAGAGKEVEKGGAEEGVEVGAGREERGAKTEIKESADWWF